MTSGTHPVALITGSSSGIGEATATTLAGLGYRVFASGRTLENVEHLRGRSPSLEIMEIDVADEDSVRRGVQRVLDAAGRIDVVVNNAGFAIFGAVEDLDREALRRQFEVNVFGAMSVCRAILPAMRRQRSGCIVNVSSMAGRISPPLLGAYCASKFALEALSDSLRVEARPFGIHVVVLEPGATLTRFPDRAMAESANVLANTDSIYASVYRGALANYTTPSTGVSSKDVARRIAHIVRTRHPAARYRVRWYDTLALALTGILPQRALDFGVSRWIGLQELRPGRRRNSQERNGARNS